MPPPPLTRSSVPPTRRQSTILAPPITLVPPEPAPAGGSRRKRRSSLSDLTNHPEYCPIIRPSRPLDDKASLVVEVEEPGQRPSPVSWAQSSLSERSGGDGKPNSPRRSPMQVPPLQARRSFGASTAPLNPGQAHRMKMQEVCKPPHSGRSKTDGGFSSVTKSRLSTSTCSAKST